MIHPVLLDLARHPGLALEHASAYAELASVEAQDWSGRLQRRALMAAGALLLLIVALGLAGAAGLMVATTPLSAMPYPWLLWAIPALPLVPGAWLAWRLRRTTLPPPFAALREQAAIDLATLRLLERE
ncbi:hypothetical protein [Hydrogenophaga sp. MI9]|uniref:hypothetical protein n=1 Tax=Hydrogenophaga sp. MI9 TaxID=3453719 RepID=UPI003EE9A379